MSETGHGSGPFTARDIMHAPWPGPGYWEWRCLLCDQPVDQHAPWWRRWFSRKPGGSK